MAMDYRDLDKRHEKVEGQELIESGNENRDQRGTKSLTWLSITSGEWISCITLHAIANWTVVIYSTLGVLATCVWARVNALLV